MPFFNQQQHRRIYYETSGKGSTPLMLFNGLTMSTAAWTLLMPQLESQFHVIRLDFQGQGLSDKSPQEAYALSAQADDAAALLDHLLGEGHPLVLHRSQARDPLDLWRVVGDQLREALQPGVDPWPCLFQRFEEARIARDQEAAQAALLVDAQPLHLVGAGDHPVGVLDPTEHIQHVQDQPDEQHRAQQADAQRQGHVARKDAAEGAFVGDGFLVHTDEFPVGCPSWMRSATGVAPATQAR